MQRRQFVRDLGLSAAASLLAMSQPGGGNASTRAVPAIQIDANSKYSLEKDGNHRVDQGLALISHPYLTAVRFGFEPGEKGLGRFVLETTHRQPGEFRLTSEELTPSNKGFIYNHPWRLVTREGQIEIDGRDDQRLVPAIRVAEGEDYRVRLGYQLLGEPYVTSYTNMRTYFVTRDGNEVYARAEGMTSLDPEAIGPRDEEAAQPRYWRKEGL